MDHICSPLYDSPIFHTFSLAMFIAACFALYLVAANKKTILFIKYLDIFFLVLGMLLLLGDAFSGCGAVFTGFFPFGF